MRGRSGAEQLACDAPPRYQGLLFFQKFRDLEFRLPRLMRNRIIELARSKGTADRAGLLAHHGAPDDPSSQGCSRLEADRINTKPALDDACYGGKFRT